MLGGGWVEFASRSLLNSICSHFSWVSTQSYLLLWLHYRLHVNDSQISPSTPDHSAQILTQISEDLMDISSTNCFKLHSSSSCQCIASPTGLPLSLGSHPWLLSSPPCVSSIKLLWPEPRSVNQEELDFCQRWARSHALGGTLFQAPACDAVLQWTPTGWAQPVPFSFWAPSRPRPYVPISKALAGSAQDPFLYVFGRKKTPLRSLCERESFKKQSTFPNSTISKENSSSMKQQCISSNKPKRNPIGQCNCNKLQSLT